MAVIPVSLAGRSYDVTIEERVLDRLPEAAAAHLSSFDGHLLSQFRHRDTFRHHNFPDHRSNWSFKAMLAGCFNFLGACFGFGYTPATLVTGNVQFSPLGLPFLAAFFTSGFLIFDRCRCGGLVDFDRRVGHQG